MDKEVIKRASNVPKAKPGRPEEMTGGKRHNIYLDAASWAAAVKQGNGNASAGIRDALDKLREGK